MSIPPLWRVAGAVCSRSVTMSGGSCTFHLVYRGVESKHDIDLPTDSQTGRMRSSGLRGQSLTIT